MIHWLINWLTRPPQGLPRPFGEVDPVIAPVYVHYPDWGWCRAA